MKLHKMVNGVRVNLTPEEEKSVLEEWEVNRIKNEKEKARLEKQKLELEERKASANKKLMSLGLTEEEIKALTTR